MSGRKGDMRRGSEKESRMMRYAVQPLGDGCYGIYDKAQQEFTETYRGRGARQKADRKWRELAGVS